MKFAIALAGLLGIGSAPALAGAYVNIESNASYTGSDFTTRTTDFHVGFEGSPTESFNYYLQGGPALIFPDGADSTTQFSGKLGATAAATQRLDFYGEVSFLSAETGDANYGTKIGTKFKF